MRENWAHSTACSENACYTLCEGFQLFARRRPTGHPSSIYRLRLTQEVSSVNSSYFSTKLSVDELEDRVTPSSLKISANFIILPPPPPPPPPGDTVVISPLPPAPGGPNSATNGGGKYA